MDKYSDRQVIRYVCMVEAIVWTVLAIPAYVMAGKLGLIAVNLFICVINLCGAIVFLSMAMWNWSQSALTRETRQPLTKSPEEYARYLIVAFAFGVLTFLVGTALLTALLFIKNDLINLVSSALLAIGSVTVALALLRGQEKHPLTRAARIPQDCHASDSCPILAPVERKTPVIIEKEVQ